MLNVKFQTLRLLNEEIDRLESIRKQIYAGRDYEKQKEYEENLNCCKNVLAILCKDFDKLAEEAFLSDKEKALAKGYYRDGEDWETAFIDVLSILAPEKLKLFENNIKQQERYMASLKKSMMRKIKKFFNYYRKKSDKKKSSSQQDNQVEA